MTKQIVLAKNKGVCLVDDEDYSRLAQFKWHWNGGYAARMTQRNPVTGKQSKVLMHHEVAGRTDGLDVDHIDGNRLNNTKANLRHCNRSQNMANIRRLNKGVTWHKGTGKWLARIRVNYKLKHLGYFNSIDEAREAYNAAAKLYFGEYANV